MMNLTVDGRQINLDPAVDRVVIERASDGSVTITSHFGVRREVIKRGRMDEPETGVDVLEGFSAPVHSNGNGNGYVEEVVARPRKYRVMTAEKKEQIRAAVAESKKCPRCGGGNHPRQRTCKHGCGFVLRP